MKRRKSRCTSWSRSNNNDKKNFVSLYMIGPVLVLYNLQYIILLFVLQMKKMRHREIMAFAQVHTSNQWTRGDWNPGPLYFKA